MITDPVPKDLQLEPEQRDAMVKELFALWRAEHPGPGTKCFSGTDADLVHALDAARSRAAREQERER